MQKVDLICKQKKLSKKDIQFKIILKLIKKQIK